MVRTAALAAALLTSWPAFAGVEFQPYEGRQTIIEGQGGTRVAKNGIDFWTTGTPPRKYQIIGVIFDTRGVGPLSRSLVGSPAIAKKTKEVGGDAVIVSDSVTETVGYTNNTTIAAIRNQKSQLLVLRYAGD